MRQKPIILIILIKIYFNLLFEAIFYATIFTVCAFFSWVSISIFYLKLFSMRLLGILWDYVLFRLISIFYLKLFSMRHSKKAKYKHIRQNFNLLFEAIFYATRKRKKNASLAISKFQSSI